MTLARPQLEMMLWWVARMRELLSLAAELTAQLQAFLEHVRNGGDPNETRRDRWVTRDDVKAKYRKAVK